MQGGWRWRREAAGGSIDQLTRRLAPRLLQETQVVWPSAAWQGAEKLDLKEGGDGVGMGCGGDRVREVGPRGGRRV